MNKAEIIELVKTTTEEIIENLCYLIVGDSEYDIGYRDGKFDGCEVVLDSITMAIQIAPNDTLEDQIETIYDWLCDKLRTDTQGICKEFREKFMAG